LFFSSSKKLSQTIAGVLLSCLLIALSFYTLDQIKFETASNTQKSLRALLLAVQESYHTLISQRKLHASILADFPLTQSLTETLLEENRKNVAAVSSPALVELRSVFVSELRKNSDRGFFIISPDRINIASMRDSNLGQVNLIQLSKPALLEKAFAGSPTFVPTISSDVPLRDENNLLVDRYPTMFVLSPIRSASNIEKVIAVLAIRIDAKTHFSNLTGLGQIGASGETYAFDKNGYMLSESRFVRQLVDAKLLRFGQASALNIRVTDPGGNIFGSHRGKVQNIEQPLTLMASSAIAAGQGHNFAGYRDYRGIDVIGTWTWDDEFNFGLTSEINLDEALEPYYRTRSLFTATSLFALFLLSLFVRAQILSRQKLLKAHAELESQVVHRTHDLTSAKNELVKTNSNLASAQAFAKLGTWTLDLFSNELTWSNETYRFFNVEAGSSPPRGIGFLKVVHRDDRDLFQRFYEDSKKIDLDYSIDIRVPQLNGLDLWLEINSEIVRDENDIPVLTRGIAQDITERKKAQQELLTARKLLDESQSVAKVGGWELDIATGNLYWTTETYHIHDTSPEEFNPSVDAGVNYFLPASKKIISAAIDDAVNNCKDYDLQLETYTTKGRKIHIRTTCIVTQKDGKATKLTGSFQDITQQKQDEKALLRSSKMDVVGQMAGGIAHDFNNLLNVIIGNLELLEIEIPKTEQAAKRIAHIAGASQRAAAVIKQLLSFSSKETSQFSSVNINDMIIAMDSLISRSITPEVSVKLLLNENLTFAKVEVGEFEGVLLNLVINARDAMPGGGELIIRTNNCVLDSAYCQENPSATPGKYVVITVQDTGKGISKQDLEHIFEPFYTTKPTGEGTGLGLAMVFRAMARCNGHVAVTTEVGKGTSFEIYVPQCEQDVYLTTGAASETVNSHRSGTILVVEDEPELRDIAQQFLQLMGYTVVTATNGEEGLVKLQAVPDISILFSDIVMPGGMNGYELARTALIQRPELKIILTSGYVDESASFDGASYEGDILMKPYSRADLTRHISIHIDN